MHGEGSLRIAVGALALILVTVGAGLAFRSTPPDPSFAGSAALVAQSEPDTVSAATAVSTTTTPTTTTLPTSSSTSAPADIAERSNSCLTDEIHRPNGRLVPVEGSTEITPGVPVVPYRIDVEEGLGVDPACFAHVVHEVLTDDRSWAARSGFELQRVDDDRADFVVALASPDTTDTFCAPLRTNGIFSCWSDGRAMINVWRWEMGIAEYADDLDVYRVYVINHEVGHALGKEHRDCPSAGAPAPVMMQQTKGLDGCEPNGWPLADE